MFIPRLKTVLLIVGLLMIGLGYWLLAVPPDASLDEIMRRARLGIYSVVAGGALLMLWLAKK